jgi:hypothetical protein
MQQQKKKPKTAHSPDLKPANATSHLQISFGKKGERDRGFCFCGDA